MCAQLFQQFYDGVALSSNIQEHMDDNKAGKEINWLGMIKQCLDEKNEIIKRQFCAQAVSFSMGFEQSSLNKGYIPTKTMSLSTKHRRAL